MVGRGAEFVVTENAPHEVLSVLEYRVGREVVYGNAALVEGAGCGGRFGREEVDPGFYRG